MARTTERRPDNETVFVVRLRADRDDVSIRALRWLLKRAKREFGMVAVSVREEKEAVSS
jgi:hypothetical protein